MRFNITRQNWAQIGEAAGWLKTAKRKNQDKNPYISGLDQLEVFANRPDVEDIYISYINEKNDVMGIASISDQSSPKIGINPKSKYNTPVGVYSYPLKEFWPQLKAHGLQNVPFAGGNPYIAVIKRRTDKNKKFVNDMYKDYSSLDYDSDMKPLFKFFVPKYLTREEFDKLKETSAIRAKEQNPVMSMWNLTRALALLLAINENENVVRDYIGGEFSQNVNTPFLKVIAALEGDSNLFPDSSGSLNIPSLKWNKIMLNVLNYAGFADKSGQGYIHPSERTQAVFFDPTAYTVLAYISKKEGEGTGNFLVPPAMNAPDKAEAFTETLKKLPQNHKLTKTFISLFTTRVVHDNDYQTPQRKKSVELLNSDVSKFPFLNQCKGEIIKYWTDRMENVTNDSSNLVDLSALQMCPMRPEYFSPELTEKVKKGWIDAISRAPSIYGLIENSLKDDKEIISATTNGYETMINNFAGAHAYRDFLFSTFKESTGFLNEMPDMVKRNKDMWIRLVKNHPGLWILCYRFNDEIAMSKDLEQFGMKYWDDLTEAVPSWLADCPFNSIKSDTNKIQKAIGQLIDLDPSKAVEGFSLPDSNYTSALRIAKMAGEDSEILKTCIAKIKNAILKRDISLRLFMESKPFAGDKELWMHHLQLYPEDFHKCVDSKISNDPDVHEALKKSYASKLKWGLISPSQCPKEVATDVTLLREYYKIHPDKFKLRSDTSKEFNDKIFEDESFKAFMYKYYQAVVVATPKELELCPFPEIVKDPNLWVKLLQNGKITIALIPKDMLKNELVITAIFNEVEARIRSITQFDPASVPGLEENVPLFSKALHNFVIRNAWPQVLDIIDGKIADEDQKTNNLVGFVDYNGYSNLLSGIECVPVKIQTQVLEQLGLLEPVKRAVAWVANNKIKEYNLSDTYSKSVRTAINIFQTLSITEGFMDVSTDFGNIDEFSKSIAPALGAVFQNSSYLLDKDEDSRFIFKIKGINEILQESFIPIERKTILHNAEHGGYYSLTDMKAVFVRFVENDYDFWLQLWNTYKENKSAYIGLFRPPTCYTYFPKKMVDKILATEGVPDFLKDDQSPQQTPETPEMQTPQQPPVENPEINTETPKVDQTNKDKDKQIQSKNTWNSFFLTSSVGKLPF